MSAWAAEPAPRLVSLDQFRGYTVLGMLLVNFVGSFAAVRATLPILGHHHTYCSYADTIMPQFLFAVGFAFRLTFLRRGRRGRPAARPTATRVRRNLGLLLVAFAVHSVGSQLGELGRPRPSATRCCLRWAKQDLFQTLGAHRGHVAVGAAGDRGPAGRPRRVRGRVSGLLHLAPVVLVQLPLGEHAAQRRGRRPARVPDVGDPAAGRLAGLRRVPGDRRAARLCGRLLLWGVVVMALALRAVVPAPRPVRHGRVASST